ncbi:hypothetical protein BB561_005651 [Smittium simulii]|uniref:Major facilitator superfamily (MFS) profile domain-containing protein n=1 Tax=Smittium simulii TaxID=133385 RepID=A0A2T9Y991_9FUNG|nr:hypothetical protein BB561_005651 [Smittium simulii]
MVNYGPSYIAAAVASIGGVLFGFDLGVMANVLTMESYRAFFNNYPKSRDGIVVSILILGSFLGSLVGGPSSDRLGRKITIMLGAIIFTVGATIQGFSVSLGMLITGRFFSGLAVGLLTQSIPNYQSELSAPEIRGRLVSLQQFAITIGIMVSFWIGIAVKASTSITGNTEWRLPFFIQICPAAILLISMFFMPYSPRWLVYNGREDEALVVLAKLRASGNTSDPDVIEELENIKQMHKLEKELEMGGISNNNYQSDNSINSQPKSVSNNKQVSYFDLLKYPLRRRLILGVLTQMFQQLTGINVIMYYAPEIFKQAGLGGSNSNNSENIATGINGIVNVLFTIPAVLYVDKWGRRKTLIAGACVCGLSYLILAISIAAGTSTYINSAGESVTEMTNKAALIFAIFSVYTFVASFAISWGPVAWIYPAEIFPMSIRSKGTSITTAVNWGSNFFLSLVSPILISKFRHFFYLVFFVFMLLAAITIYLFFPETKSATLEEIDMIFQGPVWVKKSQHKE